MQEDLSKTMGQREARKLSEMQSKETMSTLAALHNPDLSAGGRDAIADFGDRQVNSSIGPQWKSRIGGLRQAAEEMAEMGGKAGLLNVKLHKC
ncbi:polymorphic toxin type 15 domain-containing protein [Pseudomonas putida]|uniref:polymorphic toxin type 15 domain-containing protein n=1 Tax=Pseudomonas putida TaxID=303 RepID=UPI001F076DD4|nr:polymorphic toxin type 15 domain-containing protein [Pseudomonas putida]